MSVEEFLDESATEMFETISRTEKEAEAPLPVILPEITPTEDVGPRFVEEPPTSTPKVATPPATPHLQPPPKRHPRNVPKFSRFK